MYIRRKVFSTLVDDETGEERLFSTTEFMNEDSYLDERLYGIKDMSKNAWEKTKGGFKYVGDKIAAGGKYVGSKFKSGGKATKDSTIKAKEAVVKYAKEHPKKFAAEVAAGTLATAGAAYGGYKLYKHIKKNKNEED